MMKKIAERLVMSKTSQTKQALFSISKANPCMQYKATQLGFGSHFQTPVNTGVLAGNTNVRQVHERGYTEFSDVPYYLFHETNSAL